MKKEYQPRGKEVKNNGKPNQQSRDETASLEPRVCVVERHGMILDFYLEACPVQVYGIMDFFNNYIEGEWHE